MRVEIEKITSAIAKVKAATGDNKAIPGILLELGDGTLKICYSDGHRSMIEEIAVTNEETDVKGGIVVGYEQFTRVIDNSQGSGSIKVNEIQIVYNANNTITVIVDQNRAKYDGEGNVAGYQHLATKKMDVTYVAPGSDMKVSILSRMKYDDIFEGVDAAGNSIEPDVFDRKELIDALVKTSVEKSKQIYISVKTQSIFVTNQAHLTCVPIKDAKALTQEELDEIRATLTESGTFTEEAYADAVFKATSRSHFSVSMSQVNSKALIDILNKVSADTVNLYTKDKYCNVYVDEDGEKVGIWFEMQPAAKAQLGALDRYSSPKYDTYQLTFFREFLADMVKSVANSSKSDQIELRFENTTSEEPTTPVDIVIDAGNSGASISDAYRLNAESIMYSVDDITSKKFKISTTVLQAMLAQLKTELVALDFNVAPEGSVYIRISEVDYTALSDAFVAARAKAQETYNPLENGGVPFDPASTPTPMAIKQEFLRRKGVLVTKQYTILGN